MISLVLVSYNMMRELPRTLLSLSPSMQEGVGSADYEVIVVDNGSTDGTPDACEGFLSNVTVVRLPAGDPSPVVAVREGMARAQGEWIGVAVDGARLMSPGVLRSALELARLGPRQIIGTFAFHLGPGPQQRTVGEGYDLAGEDALLDRVD